MDENKIKALNDTKGIYISYEDLTEEQKLRFQGAYLTLCLLRESKKSNKEEKESA